MWLDAWMVRRLPASLPTPKCLLQLQFLSSRVQVREDEDAAQEIRGPNRTRIEGDTGPEPVAGQWLHALAETRRSRAYPDSATPSEIGFRNQPRPLFHVSRHLPPDAYKTSVPPPFHFSLQDPMANTKAYSPCIATADLAGDSEWRLLVAGDDKKMKVGPGGCCSHVI